VFPYILYPIDRKNHRSSPETHHSDAPTIAGGAAASSLWLIGSALVKSGVGIKPSVDAKHHIDLQPYLSRGLLDSWALTASKRFA